MAVKYVCGKIYQHLSLQDTPKFTQIGIFGFKIYHLATLVTIFFFPNWRFESYVGPGTDVMILIFFAEKFGEKGGF
jgi:hypothetical protein